VEDEVNGLKGLYELMRTLLSSTSTCLCFLHAYGHFLNTNIVPNHGNTRDYNQGEVLDFWTIAEPFSRKTIVKVLLGFYTSYP